jgi:hypothetical protein
MRFRSPHAEGDGRVPFALRGPKPVQKILTASVAGVIGLVPALMLASPAHANPPVYVAMDNVNAVEGQDLVFTLTYSGTSAATYNIQLTGGVLSGQATGGGVDYTEPSASTVTFPASMSPQTAKITVHTTDDKLYEPDENFTISATNATTLLDTVTATGTITDNDPAPTYTLSASPNPVDENVASGYSYVTAKLSAPSGMTTTINLTPVAGTATTPANFGSSITHIVILPGDTSGTEPVSILDDGKHDAASPMNFTVNGVGINVLAGSQNQSVQIGINDVEPTPKVTLAAPLLGSTEGASAMWTVSTDTPSTQDVTVNWDALPTTPIAGHAAATPGDDFTYPSTGRTVTIPAGSTSAPLMIPITNDHLNELPEDYTIGLSDPTNAVLGSTARVASTITDINAPPPTVSVTPISVTEGDSGKRAQTFTATLSAASGRPVTVDWNTVDNTAMAGYDYVASNGVLSFPAGSTTQTFTVGIIGDKIYEPGNEIFDIHLAVDPVDLSTSASFTVTANTDITILDDDPMPSLSVDDMSVKEGDITTAVLVPVKLSNPTSQTVTYNLTDTPLGTTSNDPGSDDPGANDYNLLNSGLNVIIPPGQLTGYGVILLNGDTTYEPDESATLTWAASNVTLATQAGTAKFTILNDDTAPKLAINDVSGKPGDTVNVTGTVTGTSQDDTRLTVTFAGQASGGKPAAGASDFVNPGGKTVRIFAGTATGSVVPIAPVQLNSATGNTPAKTIVASGVGTNNVGTATDGVITILASNGTVPPPNGAPTVSVPSVITGAGTVKVTGMATAGATVDIWGGPWSAAMPALTKIGSVTASGTGAYSFNRWIGSGYRFKAAVGSAASAEVKTAVTQKPVFLASSSSKGMVSLAVQGNPRAAGQTVTVQRWAGNAWVTGWKGTTGSDNLWKASVKEPSKSVWTLRAYVAGDSTMGVNAGYSASVKVMVK